MWLHFIECKLLLPFTGRSIKEKLMKRWTILQLLIIISLVCFSGLIIGTTQSTADSVIPNDKTKLASWDFISTKDIGAYDFIQANPTYDGRGVVVAVMDTGVDMGVPGLMETSDGNVKVIDAQDFTGEGDVAIEKGEIIEEDDKISIKHSSGKKFYGIEKLKHKPVKEKEYFIGYLDESKFVNSSAGSDLNNNGVTNDIYGVLTFEVKGETDKSKDDEGSENYWIAYIDTNLNRDFSDEKPVRDYKVNYDKVYLKDVKTEDTKTLLTMAINIFPSEKRVSFHFDDGGHGSHCAGISTGYKLNGQETLNGIAPGAQVISLKIGNNTLSGGATVTASMKKAFEYGIKYAEDNKVSLVFNLSYGIDSVIPGRAVLDEMVNKYFTENEDVVLCTSAGNSGPGLCTVGIPAASDRAITVGAMLDKGWTSYKAGAQIPHELITFFSSRGGPVQKPDVIAPGGASSTVPRWSKRENMWGTSMASPQAAGAVALLLSAANQQKPKLSHKNALIKRALKTSAKTLPWYNALEQGAGLINVPKAFKQLKMYNDRKEQNKLLDYSIETTSPYYNDMKGETAYWRTNSFFPTTPLTQKFKVKPIFPKDMTKDEKENFYRAFELKADVDWIKLRTKQTYIKGDKESLDIVLEYDKDKLSVPGLYVGTVSGYLKTADNVSNEKENVEFSFLNSIIVPVSFNEVNHYQYKWVGQHLSIGEIKRYFVKVPPAASTMTVDFEVPNGKDADLAYFIYNPRGHCVYDYVKLKSTNETEKSSVLHKHLLTQGVWEIIVYCNFASTTPSEYDFKVYFDSVDIFPKKVDVEKFKPAENPKTEFYLTNNYNNMFNAKVSGSVDGFERKFDNDISGKDTYSYSFTLNDRYSHVDFIVEMKPEVYNYFTDIAVNIYDDTGKAVKKLGLGGVRTGFRFTNPNKSSDAKTYKLEIVGAFADPSNKNWEFSITERFYLSKPIDVDIKKDKSDNFDLYPGLKNKLTMEMKGIPPSTPEGYTTFGILKLKDTKTDKEKAYLPLYFDFKE